MEKISVFTYRLAFALRLVDTTSGRPVNSGGVQVFMDGTSARFEPKGGVLVFQDLPKRTFRLRVTSSDYEPMETEVDLDKLDAKLPLFEAYLIPNASFPGGVEFLTLAGTLPGIGALSAVRAGDNACLIREFEPRKRMVKLFNPHHLSMDRVRYALVNPDKGCYEPFNIVRVVDDQTVQVDRVLETAFKNYFPVTPLVLGRTSPGGGYCLRVRDDATAAKWLVRWEEQEQPHFRMVDFREQRCPRLEEGG
jgi:hypothetical protein